MNLEEIEAIQSGKIKEYLSQFNQNMEESHNGGSYANEFDFDKKENKNENQLSKSPHREYQSPNPRDRTF
jgi:hypothetical protein